MQKASVQVVDAEYPALLRLCRGLRDLNEREIRGLWPDFTPETLARSIAQGDYSKVVLVDESPAVAFGLRESPPGGDWSYWMFGTNDYRKGVAAACLHVKRTMIPWVLERGMQKTECKSLAEKGSAEFIERMGGQRVDTAPIGANGEIYWTYRWTRQQLMEA